MKKVILVILGFGVVSMGLTWIWNEWARVAYAHFFNWIAPPFYELIGFGDARVVGLRARYINFVPFMSLVIVTPGIALRRRTIGLALGMLSISLGHLLLNLTERLHPGVSLPIVPAIVSDTLPFLVWLVVAYPVVIKLLPSPDEPETPDES
jgi:hypothetical protein